MNNKNIKVKNIIPKCGADAIIPFALIYIFYIILHGHLSPGGGFQGGVLMVGIVVLLYMGYGIKGLTGSVNKHIMHKTEGFASIMYIAFAMLGIAYAGNFCQNVLSNYGNIGDLFSSGTIFLMDTAVGVKVLTGVAVLAISMLGLVAAEDETE